MESEEGREREDRQSQNRHFDGGRERDRKRDKDARRTREEAKEMDEKREKKIHWTPLHKFLSRLCTDY